MGQDSVFGLWASVSCLSCGMGWWKVSFPEVEGRAGSGLSRPSCCCPTAEGEARKNRTPALSSSQAGNCNRKYKAEKGVRKFPTRLENEQDILLPSSKSLGYLLDINLSSPYNFLEPRLFGSHIIVQKVGRHH